MFLVNLKVLFVDDNMVVRKLFKRSVEKVAPTWDIRKASNGETALQLIDKKLNVTTSFLW